MSTTNLQFHMLLDEIICFVDSSRTRHSLQVELERWHPKAVRLLDPNADLAAEVRGLGCVDRIWLLIQPKRSRKTERFMLNVGRTRGRRLEQSQFAGEPCTIEAADVLRSLVRDLKRRTQPGVWVRTEIGSAGLSKIFRVSLGAASASREGRVELTAIGFTQRMCVDPPD